MKKRKKSEFGEALEVFCAVVEGIQFDIPNFLKIYIKKLKSQQKQQKLITKKMFLRRGNQIYFRSDITREFDNLKYSQLQTNEAFDLMIDSQYISLFTVFESHVRHIIKLSLNKKRDILKQKQTKDKNISLSEILDMNSVQELVDYAIEIEISEALRNKNSIIDWINKEFSITVNDLHNLHDKFYKYNCIRNMLVHNNGKINKNYLDTCLRLGERRETLQRIGARITITPEIFVEAAQNIYFMGILITIILWINSYPKEHKGVESFMIDQQAKFLEKRKYSKVEIISNIILLNKKQLNKEKKNIILINKAAALKFMKKDAQSKLVIKSVKSKNIAFSLATTLIEHDFKVASMLMKKIPKNTLRSYYIDWPLFKLNRRSKILKETYKKIVGKLTPYQKVEEDLSKEIREVVFNKKRA